MVLFQPSGPATVWDFSYYFSSGNLQNTIFWLSAIIGIIFALFLLSSYLNTRKPEHLYWGISFALLWILTHIAIAGGTFAYFLTAVPATFAALIVGLFAVGLFKNVKPESKFGKYLLMYVVAMSLAIGFVKNNYWGTPYWGFALLPAWVAPIVVMALHIPSAVLIIWLPLKTRDENGNSALAMTFGGVLMGLVGLLLAGATLLPGLGLTLGDFYLEIVFTAFPFVYLGAVLCFAWGTFVPKRWNFAIPGIELE
jgi:hypothetical protein